MNDQAKERVTYLWIAETVIRQHRRPLTARQIVGFGLNEGFFDDFDISRTPQKSMQARLSIDILRKGSASRFVRTERGRFYLRALLHEQHTDTDLSAPFTEYTAVRRTPLPPSERVLVAAKAAYAGLLDFQGISTDYARILSGLAAGGLHHIPRTEAEIDPEHKQFVTYTIIQQRDKLLSFRRGQYNRAAAFLRGARCIGFGGHVTEDDLNIFTFSDRGIRANAAREISEEIRLGTKRPDIDPDELEVLGFLNDDSSDVGIRHVAAVLRYWAPETPDWKKPQRGEASISQMRWLSTADAKIDLLEFEYWSQLTLRTFFPSAIGSRPTLKIVHPTAFREPHILCVMGSIGSGKSITTERLCRSAGYEPINSGRVLAKLLEIPPVPDTPRDVLQRKANEMILQADGPSRLASALIDEVEKCQTSRVIIDGIRHLHTLEELKNRSPRKIATIFVYTPPDVAYELYKIREAENPNLSLPDFMMIYNAPVESEVRLLIQEADVVIYNWFGLAQYELVVERLVSELGLR